MSNTSTGRGNLLGVYWSPHHRRTQDYDYFSRLQPAVVKIMDGGLPDYAWVYRNLPNALVVARDWALSEQHGDMAADPVGTGVRHANEWNAHAARLAFDRSRTVVLGINEPRVWEQGVPEALRLYTIAFLNECKRLNLRAGAMQLSVGWPNNRGGETSPDWSPWQGVEESIRSGNHVLALHEYWADKGPSEMWGWWGGRSLKCPWDVPILISECGFDLYVKDGSVDHNQRGWQTNMSGQRYAQELHEYVTKMAQNARFIGTCPFEADFASGEWWAFDLEPAYKAILALPQVIRNEHTVHLPIVENGNSGAGNGSDESDSGGSEGVDNDTGTTPDFFPKVMNFIRDWEGGYVDNPTDPGGATNCGITIGTLTAWRQSKGLPAATKEDVKALTQQEADEIYRAWYWGPSGAAQAKDYPTALLLMDSGVLHGVGAPQAWVEEYGLDPWRIAARRLRVYTGKDTTQWGAFGKGWTNRVAALLEEMGKG